jgi:hypothetical protein
MVALSLNIDMVCQQSFSSHKFYTARGWEMLSILNDIPHQSTHKMSDEHTKSKRIDAAVAAFRRGSPRISSRQLRSLGALKQLYPDGLMVLPSHP